MDKAHMEYRKAELSGLESHEGSYNLKVIGINGTESKWLSITQAELDQIKNILTGDTVNPALHMLANAGFIAKIYGPEDVHEALDQYGTDDEDAPVDTQTYRDQITRHIMEGDDWAGILDTEYGMDYLWGMVEGTHNDHPEWFPEA